MRRAFAAVLFVLFSSAPALTGAGSGPPASKGCTERDVAARDVATLQLAQSSCRADCRSRRGYCISSCRDSQCRAICNDLYQSCVSSCR